MSEFHSSSRRVRGEDGEVVRLVRVHLAAAAEHLADLVFDRDFVLRVVVLHADPVVEDLGVDLAEGEEREVGGVVVGIRAAAEDLLLLGEHADHGEDVAFDIDFLADWLLLAEELFRGVVAEHDDVGAPLLFFLGEEAPLLRGRCHRRWGCCSDSP